MENSDALTRLKELDKEARLFEHISALLSWDQETGMPKGAIEERAQQIAAIASLHHAKITNPEIGELLSQAKVDVDSTDGAFLRRKRREFEKNTCIPTEFVREMAELTSTSQAVWATAREKNDFPTFEPYLSRVVEMNRRLAEYLGYDDQPYDALLDQYEPFATTSEVEKVFETLQEGLVPLVAAIANAEQVDDSFLHLPYPVDLQERFGREVMSALGYDEQCGRLDRSAHPFTTTLGTNDVRITTRYQERLIQSSLFGTIHETGHALYEQGFSAEVAGTLLAEGTSLGIHESQSRLWENMVGRSKPFWSHWLPRMREFFPEQLSGVSLDDFYRAINKVAPSHIRVEADEVTYSLHVILRFRMERALISGDLAVRDAPEAWRDLSQELLGIVPGTDAEGILQDVHWSFGGFGYFPTYALGNLYGAQFLNVIVDDLPGVWEQIEAGESAPLLQWLREKIHRVGSAMSAKELSLSITGRALDAAPFLAYLERKYGEIYRL